MKTKSVQSIIGSTLAIGMLAVLPAYAGGGLIKVTHSDTPYRSRNEVAPSCATAPQKTVNQTNLPEVQIAVMAKSPVYSGPRRSMFIHR
jgi:hypothetical protein